MRFSIWTQREQGPMVKVAEAETRREALEARQAASRAGATRVYPYDGERLDKIGVHK